MFTDMVGFSALAQQNEALALELLDEHFATLRPLIAMHGGHEIKTIGDSFVVEFASPLQAVQCAIAMQTTLSTRNAGFPRERQIVLRIGIHLGDVEHRAGDVFGDGVNIAARLEPLAEPGGVCLFQQIYDHIYNKIDVLLVSMGRPEMKNMVLDRARRPFPGEPIRTLDALHVASALAAHMAVRDLAVLSLDGPIRRISTDLGLEVVPP